MNDAARALGIAPLTVRRMIARGEIPHRRAGRRVLVDLAALRPATPEEIAKLAREARASATGSRPSRP